MFGHDDKHGDEEQNEAVISTAADQVVAPDGQSDESSNDDNSWQHPGPPPNDDDETPAEEAAAPEPAGEEQQGEHQPDHDEAEALDIGPVAATHGSTDFSAGSAPSDKDELIDIKQEALGKLSPLIGHLDQTPDEKFRTLMMMIQASDDQSLVRQAYETALSIEDEKTRAQALLDIVNEINYFTQHSAKSE